MSNPTRFTAHPAKASPEHRSPTAGPLFRETNVAPFLRASFLDLAGFALAIVTVVTLGAASIPFRSAISPASKSFVSPPPRSSNTIPHAPFTTTRPRPTAGSSSAVNNRNPSAVTRNSAATSGKMDAVFMTTRVIPSRDVSGFGSAANAASGAVDGGATARPRLNPVVQARREHECCFGTRGGGSVVLCGAPAEADASWLSRRGTRADACTIVRAVATHEKDIVVESERGDATCGVWVPTNPTSHLGRPDFFPVGDFARPHLASHQARLTCFSATRVPAPRRMAPVPPPMASKKPPRPAKRTSSKIMMKLDTPVGDPIKLVLTTPANVVDHVHVVLLSGCKDSQESADVSATSEFGLPKHAGPAGAGGACTNAMLMTVHDDKPDDTWLSTLVTMRHWLHKNGYPQVPKLSCANAAFDWRAPFSLLHPHCRANPKKAGRTRALLIGINYTNSDSPLDGAWNDVDKAKKFAVASGYKEDVSSMRVLRDNGSDVSPTKVNIKKALKWLVNGASKGDSLFLHFSGHGVSLKDKDAFSDEADGKGKYFPFTTFRRLIAHTRLKLSFVSLRRVLSARGFRKDGVH